MDSVSTYYLDCAFFQFTIIFANMATIEWKATIKDFHEGKTLPFGLDELLFELKRLEADLGFKEMYISHFVICQRSV